MKTVYSCSFQEDAMVAVSMLQSADIPAELLSGGKLGVNPLFNVEIGAFTVVVPDSYADDALAIMAEYKASKVHNGSEPQSQAFQPAGSALPEPDGAAIMALARSARPRAVLHRRALHAIPEVGLTLPRTLDYVRQALSACGLKPRDCAGGLLCDIGESGPLVAIRADMDALAMSEENELDYASAIPGAMHACGHDAHTACLIALAEILADRPPKGWRARLIFQPGEEGFYGARYMLEAGCLEGVSAIVGGHLGNLSDELAPGQAGFMPGPMMAASDSFSGVFTGSGGHGSAPHQARDPIPALAQFVLGAMNLRSRKPDQRRPMVISVCQVQAGTAFNIIPSTAEFKGTVRTLSAQEREIARAGLDAACKGCALSTGVEGTFNWLGGYPALVNHPGATELAAKAASAVLGARNVVPMTVPSMGGEDFAYFLERVPGTFWFLNTQNPGKDITYPNHHPRFDLDEELLDRMMAVNLAVAEAYARALSAGPEGMGSPEGSSRP